MIGKVTVATPNPPCKCGGMAGYHYKGCKAGKAGKAKP